MKNNNEEALNLIDELIKSDGDVSLPGLDLDSVVDNFVDVKYGKELSEIKDEEQRKKLRKKWVDYYTKGEGKETMMLEIDSIKSNFSAAKDQLQFVADATVSSTASNAVPAVITVGSASSTPNPAYALIENKTKKNQLLAMLKSVGAFLINLLKSAVAICFAVPAAVISLIKLLTTTKKAVNSIPV